MLGIYNYTVVLTYIGMLTGFVGITRALDGDVHAALLCGESKAVRFLYRLAGKDAVRGIYARTTERLTVLRSRLPQEVE